MAQRQERGRRRDAYDEEQERRGTKRPSAPAPFDETMTKRARHQRSDSRFTYEDIKNMSTFQPVRVTEELLRKMEKFMRTINEERDPDFMEAAIGVVYEVSCEVRRPKSYASEKDAKRALAEILRSPFYRRLPEYILSKRITATAIQQLCDIFGVSSMICMEPISIPIEELTSAAEVLNDDWLSDQVKWLRKELFCISSPVSGLRYTVYSDEYRHASLVPTWAELLADGRPSHLQANITKGPYRDCSHYLEVHFRLLREDFVAPLRRGVRSYLKGKRGRDLSDITVYRSVKIIGPKFLLSGICYRVQFDKSCFARHGWEHSKRLLTGSLLCLSSDGFKSAVLFATVADRSCAELQRGIVTIRFEQDVHMHELCNMTETFVMIESNAFFEASKHILLNLQTVEMETMPFAEYIIRAECNSVRPPLYIEKGSTFDMSCIFKSSSENIYHAKTEATIKSDDGMDNYSMSNMETSPSRYSLADSGVFCSVDPNDKRFFDILDPQQWPSECDTTMDQSQIDALRLALTQEIAVIQGPPGTGKTYIGLKIVEVLLNNKKQWNADGYSPILVVCLTNHAVDQFLEGILNIKIKRKGHLREPREPRIVRIGGMSKNEKVKKYNIGSSTPSKDVQTCKRKLQELQRKLQEDMDAIQKYVNPTNRTFLTLSKLREFELANPEHIYQLAQVPKSKHERGHELLIWLGQYLKKDKQIAPTQLQESKCCQNDVSNKQLVDIQSEADVEESQRIILTGDEDLSENDVETNHNGDIINSKSEVEDCEIIEEGVDTSINEDKKSASFIKGHMNVANLLEMPMEMRKSLYGSWLLKYHKLMSLQKTESLSRYSSHCKLYQSLRAESHHSHLKTADVIGMTTTGAAKYQHIIHKIKPKIVIVEEAAEVLEAHIISVLSACTQHLILIGDHKQLRPKLNEYALEKDYHFNISFFERLIKNNMKHAALDIQHRMRPQIADLVRPHIYKTLQDHPSVLKYGSIKGVTNDMAFITHEYPEEHSNDTSSANSHEAKFVAALCKYLLQQQYEPSQITILTPYTGQLEKLRSFMPKDTYSGVRVTAVDNFQGEENDIILLSLVRSNADNRPGFLKEMNRVCVALSRAKKGFYCIGNFRMLQQGVPLWNAIASDVERKGCLIDGISLSCQIHNEKQFIAKLPEDFETNAPEGGCTQRCNYKLSCGHLCQRSCHPDDRDHVKYECKLPCIRECPNSHPCQKLCSEECDRCEILVIKEMVLCHHTMKLPCHKEASCVPCTAPCLRLCKLKHPCQLPCYKPCRCDVVVRKQIPSCQHEQDVPCHMDPQEYKCQVPVVKVVPHCHHKQRMLCGDDPNTFPCEDKCINRLPCGHKCPLQCKEQCPKICREVVKKVVLQCSHEYEIECHEEQNNSGIMCLKPCTKLLRCGHPCTAKCHILCETVQCKVVVEKMWSCGHTLKRECYMFQSPQEYPCDRDCDKQLACGHKCEGMCREPCNAAGCEQKCSRTLLCGHACSGTCGECFSRRMHQACDFDVRLMPFCGHVVNTACRGVEHQCQKQFTFSCPHSAYELACFPDTASRWCTRPCVWECPHHKCHKLCYEKCDRGPCNRPCLRPLRCGHQCASLCGEPCLTACPQCQELAFRRQLRGVNVRNRKLPPDQHYIQLKPCKHIFPVEFLDKHMKQSVGVICPKQCPEPDCHTNICCGYRYGNAAKAMLNDCVEVSKQMQGIVTHSEAVENSVNCRNEGNLCIDYDLIVRELQCLVHPTKDMYYFKHLLLAGHDLLSYMPHRDDTYNLRKEFLFVCSNFIDLCKTPSKRRVLLSEQLVQDFTSEMYRMYIITMLDEFIRIPSSDLRKELTIKQTQEYLTTLQQDHFKRVSHEDFTRYQRKLHNPVRRIHMIEDMFSTMRCQWIKCDKGHYYSCPPKRSNLMCPQCQDSRRA